MAQTSNSLKAESMQAKSAQVKIEGTRYSLENRFLLVCESRTRQESALTSLGSAFFGTSDFRLSSVQRIGFSQTTATDLINTLGSRDLFSPRRAVFVTDIEKIKEEDFNRVCIFAAGDPDLFLGFLAPSLPAKSFLRNSEQVQLIELSSLEGEDLLSWVKRLFITREATITHDNVAKAIIDLADANPDLIVQYVEQVTLLANRGESITIQTVRELFPEVVHIDEFQFIEIVASGNYAAICHYLTLLDKKGSNFFGLVGLLFRTFSQFQRIVALQHRGQSAQNIAEALGQSRWIVEKQQKLLRAYGRQTSFAGELDSILQASLALRRKSLAPLDIMCALGLQLRPVRAR
jgi:DNA polymerase III delta subunit